MEDLESVIQRDDELIDILVIVGTTGSWQINYYQLLLSWYLRGF